MIQSRRRFLATSAATVGGVTFLPYMAQAADTFSSDAGDITIHPIEHASFVMETPLGTIHVDPVGEASAYADLPAPELILITHEHGDHYNVDTLTALAGENTRIISNPAVHDMMPPELQEKTTAIGNGENASWGDLGISAIPAHNTTEDRMQFHPPGRDNGYVLDFNGFRVYISGDTEDIPEMRALENIDLAFVCMNLPFTMDATAAASAVLEFQPTYVYPYHYHGRDGGTQDPAEFAGLVGEVSEVKMGNWYG
ncbi:MBL fold metallo-hydrolase [Amaricoccus tamworthensis]|uniref:MBL fold metallo-hydrolase n=1 Tax=Amaricoccus tamworthensis TaxID=57002 RepID=UPI003C79779A